ncbi:uncharacterized protein Z520_10805 [Fonsecaea multimorphosa CBS 102226]|uniref:Uncharacterized protein n=1 Tax=Fonsecaea multimorphosa CBS 102226 TaxID=1442371 RepID=A0A0D2I873_9EURO|nr:uncharacterized protein Z520_10805 [Fonsecaea multimorphosa CBS 102226]KIX93386.1 hypothetical protein Z520_10805 [Fonsecaea multimorphosa CBS 102226]
MYDSSSTQSVTSSQSDSAASSSTLHAPVFEIHSPSSLVGPSMALQAGQDGVDDYAMTMMLQEPRLETPYFAGQPLGERRMEHLARLDIVLGDLQHAFAGQWHDRLPQEEL